MVEKCLARIALAPVVGLALVMSTHTPADACGCLSPPVPTVSEAEYAVNQQAEQIIFEVEPGYVTAHVLIRYQGDPSKFAWIVPVPSVPDLSLSESLTFALLDDATAPIVSARATSLCPSPEYACMQHSMPNCGDPNGSTFSTGVGPGPSSTGSGMGAEGEGEGESPPGVEIIEQQQIGSYDTVTFSAGDASAAVTWLQDEGFIVNDTMTPFMQPYVDANMIFVAAKLIPGADLDEIAPLRMRYQADNPMIPLQLTAVAAEPHLTVTSYIYGSERFQPAGHPEITIDPAAISHSDGRLNYPMVLARAVDEVGGDGFVTEFASAPPEPGFWSEPCCSSDFDSCFIESDGICQCPGRAFDDVDCAEEEDLLNSVALMNQLREDHGFVTRISTRISADEMSFDPGFEPFTSGPDISGRLVLEGQRYELEACWNDVIDKTSYSSIELRQQCAAVYCGQGSCVVTAQGDAGCDCDEGYVGRTFTDLDSQLSVTCVPDTHTVDFAAAGITLPDACTAADCGNGTCIDVGGFPTCACDPGFAASLSGDSTVPSCAAIEESTGNSGARDYSAAHEALAVCAPAPPECGEWGWLVPNANKTRQGVVCASSHPSDEAAFDIPAEPTCADLGLPELNGENGPKVAGGCGCASAGTPDGLGWSAFISALALAGLRRRRRSPVA